VNPFRRAEVNDKGHKYGNLDSNVKQGMIKRE